MRRRDGNGAGFLLSAWSVGEIDGCLYGFYDVCSFHICNNGYVARMYDIQILTV